MKWFTGYGPPKFIFPFPGVKDFLHFSEKSPDRQVVVEKLKIIIRVDRVPQLIQVCVRHLFLTENGAILVHQEAGEERGGGRKDGRKKKNFRYNARFVTTM